MVRLAWIAGGIEFNENTGLIVVIGTISGR
jgi:hypothetical protein